MTVQHYGLGEIDWENVNFFFDFINKHCNTEDFHLKLYLQCSGGETNAKDILARVINQYSHEIHVIAIESSAFDLVSELTGPIYLAPPAYGMYHAGKLAITFRDGFVKDNQARLSEHRLKMEYDRTNDTMLKLNFTDDERNGVLRGDDVYFTRDRLWEMFADRIGK